MNVSNGKEEKRKDTNLEHIPLLLLPLLDRGLSGRSVIALVDGQTTDQSLVHVRNGPRRSTQVEERFILFFLGRAVRISPETKEKAEVVSEPKMKSLERGREERTGWMTTVLNQRPRKKLKH